MEENERKAASQFFPGKSMEPLDDGILRDLLADKAGCKPRGLKRERLKGKDISIVELVTFLASHDEIKSFIVKVVVSPLEREAAVYERLGPSDHLPRLIASHALDHTHILVFEPIRGKALIDDWKEERILRAAKILGKIHADSQRGISAKLPYEEIFPPMLPRIIEASLGIIITNIAGQWPEFAERLRAKAIGKLAECLEEGFSFFRPVIVHGDLFAENIVRGVDAMAVVDWTFAFRGQGLFDIHTLSLKHHKNGNRNILFERLWRSYSKSCGRTMISEPSKKEMKSIQWALEGLDRLKSISWLAERERRGMRAIGPLKQWAGKAMNELSRHLGHVDTKL